MGFMTFETGVITLGIDDVVRLHCNNVQLRLNLQLRMTNERFLFLEI